MNKRFREEKWWIELLLNYKNGPVGTYIIKPSMENLRLLLDEAFILKILVVTSKDVSI